MTRERIRETTRDGLLMIRKQQVVGSNPTTGSPKKRETTPNRRDGRVRHSAAFALTGVWSPCGQGVVSRRDGQELVAEVDVFPGQAERFPDAETSCQQELVERAEPVCSCAGQEGLYFPR
jgi:hypothetical protein